MNMNHMTKIGSYTLAKTGDEYRLTWIENNQWNTLWTKSLLRVKAIIERL